MLRVFSFNRSFGTISSDWKVKQSENKNTHKNQMDWKRKTKTKERMSEKNQVYIKGKKSHEDDMRSRLKPMTVKRTTTTNNHEENVLIPLTNLIKTESAIISCRLWKMPICYSKCSLPLSLALITMWLVCVFFLSLFNLQLYIYNITRTRLRLIVVCQPLFSQRKILRDLTYLVQIDMLLPLQCHQANATCEIMFQSIIAVIILINNLNRIFMFLNETKKKFFSLYLTPSNIPSTSNAISIRLMLI